MGVGEELGSTSIDEQCGQHRQEMVNTTPMSELRHLMKIPRESVSASKEVEAYSWLTSVHILPRPGYKVILKIHLKGSLKLAN